ncbi:PP2C family protein-serine/threonine phosphatase [Microvirga terrestris]|uniref:SpoIIE family protein phosphatase n=1 Tax=Microvirga terrestris TaxID=2791024 RepID=A0ABS0HWF7_9HYPH|nr:PP2C family protein-serine/threonine phosphatase [Microvirga terrestris]MBF9197841.1 SpoIIE family protein phosphatase [Microvirga terrestris]
MKIRHILLLLTAFLGAALLIAVAFQIRDELLGYQTAERMVASNTVREQLLLGTEALANERSQTYVLLIGQRNEANGLVELRDVRRQVDDLLNAAEREITVTRASLSNASSSLKTVSRIRQEIRTLRQQADQSLGLAEGARGEQFAPRWFQEATRLVDELQSSRMTILQRERPLDPVLRTEANLRAFGAILSESIARNQALMSRALENSSELGGLQIDAISQNAGRAALAWELIDGQMAVPLSESVKGSVSRTHENYSSTFAPIQRSLLAALLGKVPPTLGPAEWYDLTGRTLSNIALMQRELLHSTRDRLEAELSRAQRSVALWSVLLLLGAAAVLASILVVRRRVVRPLEGLSQAMLRLADNDLEISLPRLARADEIGEMNDALRVFKANAIQRQRTQNEKQVLHARLRDAYGQLRKDLEAAAVIQRTMLPPSARIDGVEYHGLFRPSSLIAGDTYNVVRRTDGAVGFFQVDVAGHGAAAALVSVACHHALSQAILTRTQGTPLEEIVVQINEEWPEDLPYFTMILGEIDSRSQRASIIQAGHPSPLVIRSNGAVEMIGEGGFPVGMLPAASYERLEFDLGPGDRLFIYSDGLVEAEDQGGEQFSEDRLRALVREVAEEPSAILLDRLDDVLRNWRGSETLDDDLSVLMLERSPERMPANAVH